MLILLPPSEGKSASGTGAPLDPATLWQPSLNPARERVLAALVALCAADVDQAVSALGLSGGQRAEVLRNVGLRGAATSPAEEIYSGVLYDALAPATLPAPARRSLARSVLIFSGLWGAVRLGDRIPPYRCAIGARLPGLGGLGTYWRGAMQPVLTEAAGDDLVLDLRSSAYAASWSPQGTAAGQTVAVRVLQERRIDGAVRRSVVSHFNKATKGRLVRDLALAAAAPRTPAELVTALRELAYTVEVQTPAAAGRPGRIDVIVTEL